VRRLWRAIRAFWRVLVSRDVAEAVQELLARGVVPRVRPEPVAPKVEPKRPQPKAVARSEAITLLATLQREARFVDFVKEPLDGYSDAQIGAVARDVHRDCAKVLDRLFAIAPVVGQEDGSEVEVPAGFDAGRYRLSGQVAGKPPFRGRLVHHGWEATRCELPAWSGSVAAAGIVAPVEVEMKAEG
jgi:hypothetical protein